MKSRAFLETVSNYSRHLSLYVIIFLLNFSVFAEELKNGDLIFMAQGTGKFSEAISEATAQEDSIKLVHVGIITITDKNDIYVLEADPQKGVIKSTLEEFLERAPRIEGNPAVTVRRLDIDFPIEEAIKRAESHLGEPYDWWYLKDNGKMYCSELIYESYLDDEGKPIFQAQPMNFRSSDGTMPEFWVKLFEELGEPIPEGDPGTNPQDLSKDPRLKEIVL